MEWFEQVKKIITEGFEELVRNPALLNDAMNETLDDLDSIREDVQEVVENARPVIHALTALVDVVSQMKSGNTSRALSTPQLHVAGMRIANKINVPDVISEEYEKPCE